MEYNVYSAVIRIYNPDSGRYRLFQTPEYETREELDAYLDRLYPRREKNAAVIFTTREERDAYYSALQKALEIMSKLDQELWRNES